MANNKSMSKPVLYGIFIIKFFLGLGLIVWTVMMTLSSDVGEDQDNAFLSTYHNIDSNFNNMVKSNLEFKNKYNLKFYLNDEIIDGLTINDVFLSQRVINKRKIRKDIIKIGENKFRYEITNKTGKKIDNINLTMLITMATNHIYDKKLEFKDNKINTFIVKKQGYWNITGTIEVDNDKGYFFIKTNSKGTPLHKK